MRLLILLMCTMAVLLAVVPAWSVAMTDLPARVFPDPDGVLLGGLPYRLYVPKNYDPAKSYPLVLFLHGAGERGVNNLRQGGNGALLWTQPAVQEKHPCFVVLPQCPQAIDTFQMVKADGHPCGLHEFTTILPTETAVKRLALPVGQFMRGEKKTMVFLTDAAKKDQPVDLILSNIRLSQHGKDEGDYLSFAGRQLTPLVERFFMTAEGCYCTETPDTRPQQPAMESTISDDGRTIQLKSAPGAPLRLGVDCPVIIGPEAVLYADLQIISAGSGQRIGFLQGDRLPEYRWVNTDWGLKTPHTLPAQPSAPLRLTLGILEALRKEYTIDPTRIYVTGLSMGGYGTWDIIARRPDLFAAAIPVCGGGDPATAPTIAGIPIWAFHGGSDGVVPTDRTRLMIEALKKAGATPRYTEYPGVGHNSWTQAYAEPELVEWLFTQQQGGAGK